ncbi:unnamed protein product, partial [Ascophyllum nodosum]
MQRNEGNNSSLAGSGYVNGKMLSRYVTDLPAWDNFTVYFEHVIGEYCDPVKFSKLLGFITAVIYDENPAINVGGVIDTCHVYASGYNVSDYHNFNDIYKGKVLVHLNDSVHGFDSKIDRHAEFGTNTFTPESLDEFINSIDAEDFIIELK